MLNYNLVLKSGELYTAGEIETDGSRERATGVYFRDTRHLSAFEVTIDGTTPELLSVTRHNPASATVVCSNRLIEREDGQVFPQRLLVVQNVTLNGALEVGLSVQNFDHQPLAFQLGVLFAADFRDLFDIRGFHRDQRGRWTRPKAHAQGIELGYVGLDGKHICTAIEFDQDCTVTPVMTTAEMRDGSLLYLMNTEHGHMNHELHEVPAANLTFDLALEPHERRVVNFVITPHPALEWERMPEMAPHPAAVVSTDNALFNEVLDQCQLDLDALQTTFPHGSLPAAGIPWFVAPFGRDSLITSLQTLHISPERAAGTVRALAALQGTRVDPAREEQPGKILHEMRYGEMARIGEVPHSPYYGSVDATPLWLWLLAETVIWTGDRALLDDLMPNVQAALTWIDRYGDLDGDGLVEYRTDAQGVGHITHQVWKDSFDSLNHVDGAPAYGPVAAVEVQGYIYAAYARLAVATSCAGLADNLRKRADAMRSRIDDLFWLETEGTYAQALDGGKRPVSTASSNAGQLLACGVPSAERAARMAARFQEADFDCGWGLRTLSKKVASYNPMSYHNGSVWPHDNSLIGGGLYRYGEAEAGHLVSTALFDVALRMPMHRLPELYCGFAREGIALDRPVDYPVSCSPQAWASGALPYLVRAMLGMEIDPETRRLSLAPAFPCWLNELTIRDLRVLGREGTLIVRRGGGGYVIDSVGLPLSGVA